MAGKGGVEVAEGHRAVAQLLFGPLVEVLAEDAALLEGEGPDQAGQGLLPRPGAADPEVQGGDPHRRAGADIDGQTKDFAVEDGKLGVGPGVVIAEGPQGLDGQLRRPPPIVLEPGAVDLPVDFDPRRGGEGGQQVVAGLRFLDAADLDGQPLGGPGRDDGSRQEQPGEEQPPPQYASPGSHG